MSTTKEWSTDSFLSDVRSAARPNAMIILNTPLPHHDLFAKLWDACTSLYHGMRYAIQLIRIPDQARSDIVRMEARIDCLTVTRKAVAGLRWEWRTEE